MALPLLVVTPTKGHMGGMSQYAIRRSTRLTVAGAKGQPEPNRSHWGFCGLGMLPESRSSDKRPIKKGHLSDPFNLVGTIGLEPTTPTMSRWCSNQLSYVPAMEAHSTEAARRVNSFFPNYLNKRIFYCSARRFIFCTEASRAFSTQVGSADS